MEGYTRVEGGRGGGVDGKMKQVRELIRKGGMWRGVVSSIRKGH